MSETEMPSLTEPWQFRAANYFIGAVMVMMAVHQVTRGTPFNLAVGVLVLLGTAGVLRALRWGRWMAMIFLSMLLVYSLANVLPARIEVDEALGREPASSTELWVQLILMSGTALGSLHLLGRYRTRYRAAWW